MSFLGKDELEGLAGGWGVDRPRSGFGIAIKSDGYFKGLEAAMLDTNGFTDMLPLINSEQHQSLEISHDKRHPPPEFPRRC